MRRVLKILHVASTGWFMLAVVYLLVLQLRQAGFEWWLIFSLSGNGAAMAFLLISVYVHTLFGNTRRNTGESIEHPLTNSGPYVVLYSMIPFLGTLAGLQSIFSTDGAQQVVMAAAIGTLGATFFFWIILDPAINFSEMLLPASRAHRLARHTEARAVREQKQFEHMRLLADLEEQEKAREQQWQEVLGVEADKLAALAMQAADGDTSVESAAIETGLRAWQYGGLSCMKKLCEMASDICRSRGRNSCDGFVSLWWDGIGQWRHELLT
jgi:hypothetical protein